MGKRISLRLLDPTALLSVVRLPALPMGGQNIRNGYPHFLYDSLGVSGDAVRLSKCDSGRVFLMNSMQHWWKLMRWAVAGVWLYQGLWHKIIAVDEHHLQIVASVPSYISPRFALGAIGAVETLFAVCVLGGIKKRLVSALQILLLVGMNAGGCFFAGDKIPDIPGMLTMNFVFILAIWGIGHYDS